MGFNLTSYCQCGADPSTARKQGEHGVVVLRPSRRDLVHDICDDLERVVPRRRPLLKAVDPVKKLHQHSQRLQLLLQHHVAQICLLLLRGWAVLELQVPPLERDGVVEGEPRRLCEEVRGEILIERARNIGEHEGNVCRGPAEGVK